MSKKDKAQQTPVTAGSAPVHVGSSTGTLADLLKGIDANVQTDYDPCNQPDVPFVIIVDEERLIVAAADREGADKLLEAVTNAVSDGYDVKVSAVYGAATIGRVWRELRLTLKK